MDISTLIILGSVLLIVGGLTAAAYLISAELKEAGRIEERAADQRRALEAQEKRIQETAKAGDTRHELDRADFSDVVDRL